MEELLFGAFERERQQHAAQVAELKAALAAKDAVIQRQRKLWEADTQVSDATCFLYGSWLKENEDNPAVKQMMSDARAVADECPPMSRVNRIMCTVFAMEQKAADIRTQDLELQVAQLKATVKEQGLQLARLGPIDKILGENAFLQGELMEMGKKVIALEDYVNKAEEIVGQRIEEETIKVKEEGAKRRALAHEVLNTLHSELMRILCQLFDGKEGLTFSEKIELQGVLVHHLDKVRLVLHAT